MHHIHYVHASYFVVFLLWLDTDELYPESPLKSEQSMDE